MRLVTDIVLPVTLTAIGFNGDPFEQEVMTVNISRRGALLRGVSAKLRVGANVSLSRLRKTEEFVIVSTGKDRRAGEIGLSAINPSTTFWDDAIETLPGAAAMIRQRNYSQSVPIKAHASAN